MKKIIILDDHCKEKFFYLLEDYFNAIEKYFLSKHGEQVEFIWCSDVRAFADAIKKVDVSNEYHGWIVDMMVPTEGMANYDLLGRSDIGYSTARSGALALKAVIEYDKPINKLSEDEKSRLAALANRPALIFSMLREGNLAREINDVGINDIASVKVFSASKAEVDVVDLKLPQNIEAWCDQVVR